MYNLKKVNLKHNPAVLLFKSNHEFINFKIHPFESQSVSQKNKKIIKK